MSNGVRRGCTFILLPISSSWRSEWRESISGPMSPARIIADSCRGDPVAVITAMVDIRGERALLVCTLPWLKEGIEEGVSVS